MAVKVNVTGSYWPSEKYELIKSGEDQHDFYRMYVFVHLCQRQPGVDGDVNDDGPHTACVVDIGWGYAVLFFLLSMYPLCICVFLPDAA